MFPRPPDRQERQNRHSSSRRTVLARYVRADLLRNPRVTLTTLVGIALGVGLFCGVLFLSDGLSASMTERALAPLSIDMQHVVGNRVGSNVQMTQMLSRGGELAAGQAVDVELEVVNDGAVDAGEVTVRSVPDPMLVYVDGSASVDGVPIDSPDGSPFAAGPAAVGLNLGTLRSQGRIQITYQLRATDALTLADQTVQSSFSTRESVASVPAGDTRRSPVALLAASISGMPGVGSANPLSIADLGPASLHANTGAVTGPAKIFGFDAELAAADDTITLIEGSWGARGAVVSAEASRELRVEVGDQIIVTLPDGSVLQLQVSGVADLSRSRSLFSSRRGGDLETFVYVPQAVVVSAATFESAVQPAFARAASARGARLKSPPIREIDVAVDRSWLDEDPASALAQTIGLAADMAAAGAPEDNVLDNISNTLSVAAADADAAKGLFFFLGIPGAVLAAMLSGYAGSVMAGSQRRDLATLRMRGAGAAHLRQILALRTATLTVVGTLLGLVIGGFAARAVLQASLLESSGARSLGTSVLLGLVAGTVVTGGALVASGRRAINDEIETARLQLDRAQPLWRRLRVDAVAVIVVVVGTLLAQQTGAFDGRAGSVYFGRAVRLNVVLLLLPLGVWLGGSMLAARAVQSVLTRAQPPVHSTISRPRRRLVQLSLTRRPEAIASATIIVSLIVALSICLAGFRSSYDAAKLDDARFANGADIRVTPGPTDAGQAGVNVASRIPGPEIRTVTPVIHGRSNVILRSDRTSDPANLVAVDPALYADVSPLSGDDFSADLEPTLRTIDQDPTAIVLSEEMAAFLQTEVGDRVVVLLARATDEQVEVELVVSGLFRRLPGFPEGADALMSFDAHHAAVPTKAADFYLVGAEDPSTAGVEAARGFLADRVDGRARVESSLDTLARDQSSLAALNISGLVTMDAGFALMMTIVALGIFVFGLMLKRRKEYVTLRALGVPPRAVTQMIVAEAGTVATVGSAVGTIVGGAMGWYFVSVLRPLFVLTPEYVLNRSALVLPWIVALGASLLAALLASRMVNRLDPTELLRS